MTARSSPSGQEELPDCPDRGAPKQQAMCRRITITVVFMRTPREKARLKKPPNNRVLHFCPPYSRACAHHKFFLPIKQAIWKPLAPGCAIRRHAVRRCQPSVRTYEQPG